MLDPSILVGSSKIPTAVGIAGAASAESAESALASSGSVNKTPASEEPSALPELREQVLAAAVQILSSCQSCQNLADTAQLAARQLSETLSIKCVQIAWRTASQSTCQRLANSHPVNDGTNGGDSKLWQAAAEEISHRGDLTVFPTADPVNRHSLLAVTKWAESIACKGVIGTPLVDADGINRGAIIAILDSNLDIDFDELHRQRIVWQFQAVTPGIANRLATIQLIQPRRWEQTIRNLTGASFRKRRRIAMACGVLLTAALLIPVPYKISAFCELQPVQRRMVAAPFDAQLQSVAIRPGDVVTEGEVLATLNPREIDFQLAGISAELRRAIQEKKGRIADHDSGGSELASLEAQRLQFQHDLLDHRRANLQIRSPLSGIVVAGDMKPSVGSPLTKGDALFEIAPLEEMVVEIAIPERDFSSVRAGMKTQVWLDAVSEQVFTGTVDRVHPRAELRDADNVFIAEVRLSNQEGRLRPGMRGRVRIKSDSHPLGWNLFHRAYYAARQTIGW